MRVAITANLFEQGETRHAGIISGFIQLNRWFLWPTEAVERDIEDAIAAAVEQKTPGRFKQVRVHILRARRLWW